MNDPARMYRESAVRCASPVGLVVILYEEVIRSLRKAQHGIKEGNIEERTLALSHAIRVTGHLQAVLNFEVGEDVARDLSAFYNAARKTMIESGRAANAEKLASLAADFSNLAHAWRQIDSAAVGFPQRVKFEAAVPHPSGAQVSSTGSPLEMAR